MKSVIPEPARPLSRTRDMIAIDNCAPSDDAVPPR